MGRLRPPPLRSGSVLLQSRFGERWAIGRTGDSGDTWSGDTPGGVDRAGPEVAEPDRYQLVERIGEGGMGTVDAVRDRLLGRVVARKALRSDLGGRAERRFLREARLTSQLDHPNVVPVHDLGRGPDEAPYFTMRRIVGRSVDERLADGTLGTLVARLDLFRKVCDAIAFAHAHGILHTDLKPSNVMVGDFGEVVVVDWGIARRLASVADEGEAAPAAPSDTVDDTDGGLADRTVDGQIVGTPAWMAPEQARGERSTLDERVDVYGLGALLYVLLAGRAPFGGGPGREVLAAVREGRFPRPRSVDAGVPGELEAVVLKAMATARERRYRSVQELRADVQGWLEGGPLSVVPETWVVRGRRLLRRHGRAVTVAVGVALLGFAGAAVGLGLHGRQMSAANLALERSRDAARRAEAEAVEQSAESLVALAQVEAEQGHPDAARARLRSARELLVAHGGAVDKVDLVAAALASSMPPPTSDWTVSASATVGLSPSGELLAVHDGGRLVLAEAASGRVVASHGDGTLPVNGRFVGDELLLFQREGDRSRVSFRGHGWLLPSGYVGGTTGVVGDELWFGEPGVGVRAIHLLTGELRTVLPEIDVLMALSADGRRLIGYHLEGNRFRTVEGVGLYEVGPGGGRLLERYGGTNLAQLSPDGRRWLFQTEGGLDVYVDGRRTPIPGPPNTIGFLVGEDQLVTGDRDGVVNWYRGGSSEPEASWTTPGRLVGVSADAQRILVQLVGRVQIWDRPPTVASPSGQGVTEVLASADGELLVSAGWEGRVEVHDADTRALLRSIPVTAAGVRDVAWWPGEREVVVADRDGKVRRLDLVTGEVTRGYDCGAVGLSMAVAPLPDGGVVAVWEKGELCAFSEDGAVRTRRELGMVAWELRYQPEADRVLVSIREELRTTWLALDPTTLAERARSGQDRVGYELALAPTGTAFAVGMHTDAVWVDDAGREARLEFDEHPTAVAFSGDGRTLAVGNLKGEVGFWRVPDGRRLATLTFPGENLAVSDLVFAGRVLHVLDWQHRWFQVDLGLAEDFLGAPSALGSAVDPGAEHEAVARRHARRGQWGLALDELLAAERSGRAVDALEKARWAFAAGRSEDASRWVAEAKGSPLLIDLLASALR